MEQNKQLPSQQIRQQCREGKLQSPTPGLAEGYVQANLVILPEEYSEDFKQYCIKNPKPCPLIEDFQGFIPQKLAKNSDIRTDLPKYRIFINGEFKEEVCEIQSYLEKNCKNQKFHSFLIGCSFTFEFGLLSAGLKIRHIEENKNVPMYITNLKTEKSGVFEGNMVVSMRPFKKELVEKVIEISNQFPTMHGGPVFVGDYKEIGINDINKPEYGDAVTINEGEVTLFWGCGVTPQQAIQNAKLPIVFTHAPGHMFICDKMVQDYRINQ